MAARKIIPIIITLCALLFSPPYAASRPGPDVMQSGRFIELRAKDGDAFTKILPPAQYLRAQGLSNANVGATIQVTYIGFSAQAQAAFQHAVNIWASLINSSVPIQVTATWEPLGAGVLGSAGSPWIVRNFANAPVPNVWYQQAVANSLAGTDQVTALDDPATGGVDVQASFNSTFASWYMGTDGNTPAGQWDFVTVVIHELCHGLGFSGFADPFTPTMLFSGSPYIYSTFVETGGGTDVTTLSGAALTSALTGGDLWFNGPNAFSSFNSNHVGRIRIYAPNPWESGSSFSHFDETTYPPGTDGSLMTPFLNPAEANHSPGNHVLGLFQDVGWNLASQSPLPLFSKTFVQNPITLLDTSTLTFTVDHASGTDDAASLAFTDTFPAGMTVAQTPNASTTCAGGLITAVPGSGGISFSGGAVTAGGTCTISVDVESSATGDLVNTSGSLTSSLGDSGTAGDTLRVNPPPAFSKSFSPNPVAIGDPSTLTFLIDNTGSTVAAASLAFADTMPSGMVIAGTPNASATCAGGTLAAAAGGSLLTYAGGTVNAGASCTVSVDVVSTTAGSLVNTSGALTSSLGSSGTAADTLTVNAPPLFTKVFSPNPVSAGDTTTLTLTIDNTGSTAAAGGLAFTDNMPAGLAVPSTPNASTTCTGGTLTIVAGSGGSISYAGGTVPAGSTCTVVSDVSSNTPGSHTNTSGALVSSLGNSGTASDTLVVAPPSFVLAIIKSGNGSGTVTADVGAIDCGAVCQDSYLGGTTVTLSATPLTGSTFSGWSGGGCSGTGTCVVDVSSHLTVTATFNALPRAVHVPGDWDKDGFPDMIWRDGLAGRNLVIYFRDNLFAGKGRLPSAPSPWEMVAADDFNQDDNMDLIWRNRDSGLVVASYFKNTEMQGLSFMKPVASPWNICGSGDMNQDQKPDLVVCNSTTGEHEAHFFDGTTQIGTESLPSAPLPWKLVAVDDFDKDGFSDLVVTNQVTGWNAVGYLTGTSLKGVGLLPVLSLPWEIIGTQDVDQDGFTDIILHNPSTRENKVWYLQDRTLLKTADLPAAPIHWYGISGRK